MKRTHIVELHRLEGHDIKRGQVLFVAETRKGTEYCEAKVLGILSKILVERGGYVAMQSVWASSPATGKNRRRLQKSLRLL